ncbi:MAG: hypothetical protein R3C99_05165 [Pirellulaceae bacterium]
MKRVRTWLVMAWLAISFRFANADDWQHWRGPNRNGITSETSGWAHGTWLSAEPRWRAQWRRFDISAGRRRSCVRDGME